MPDDGDGQDHMFRFIPLKEMDRSAKFGEVATPKVLHDMIEFEYIWICYILRIPQQGRTLIEGVFIERL